VDGATGAQRSVRDVLTEGRQNSKLQLHYTVAYEFGAPSRSWMYIEKKQAGLLSGSEMQIKMERAWEHCMGHNLLPLRGPRAGMGIIWTRTVSEVRFLFHTTHTWICEHSLRRTGYGHGRAVQTEVEVKEDLLMKKNVLMNKEWS
jgi:hypothetical protein